MGNVHVFGQRFPVLVSACISSLAIAFAAIAGTTCSFLVVQANEGHFIESSPDGAPTIAKSASFGVLCESELFDSDGDTMWKVSMGFLYVSLAFGALTTALAWALTWIVSPNDGSWKLLSIMSALTAVFNIPIFLIFEAGPCIIDPSRQQCTVSFGCYILIASTVCSIAVTLLTQCVDPPHWANELDAWKVRQRSEEEAELRRGAVASDEFDDGEDPAQAAATAGILEGFRRWNMQRRWAKSNEELKESETFPVSRDEEEGLNVDYQEAGSYYANSSNSRLLLKVTPDGKCLGDDKESIPSFGDLDEDVKMAEEERGGSLLSLSVKSEETNLMVPNADGEDGAEILVILPRKGSLRSMPPKQKVETFSDEPMYYSELKPPPSDRDEKSLLSDRGEDDDTDDEADPDDSRNKLSIGIRSLTNRMLRDASRCVKSGKAYTMMDDEGEDAEEAKEYAPPPAAHPFASSPDDSFSDDGSNRAKAVASDSDHLHHQKLIYDWNALHAAASAGILLAHEQNSDSSDEDDPEPVYCTTTDEDSFQSAMSRSSLGADGEDIDSSFSDSSLSDISDLEDSKEDLPSSGILLKSSPRKDRRRAPSLRRNYSSHSLASSYTSVLDMTIDEETDIDLKEFESSGDDVTENGRMTGYASAPETIRDGGRLLSSPYTLLQSASDPNVERGYIIPKAKGSDSASSNSSNSSRASELVKLAAVSQVSPVIVSDSSRHVDQAPTGGRAVPPEQKASESETLSPVTASDRTDYYSATGGDSLEGSLGDMQKLGGPTPSADEEESYRYRPNPRRSRSMSIPRRKVAPFTPTRSSASSVSSMDRTPDMKTRTLEETQTTMEETPDSKMIPWRVERLYKAGIHSDAVHIVSDEENSPYMSEASGMSCRSARSCMSRKARKARIRRMQLESEACSSRRHRARTLDPPKNRRRYQSNMRYSLPDKTSDASIDSVALDKLSSGNNDASFDSSTRHTLPGRKLDYSSDSSVRYTLPDRNNATLNRLLFGKAYGPEHGAEEASL